ncbi:MAG: FAD-dependent thymidylate synthase [Candidatus Dormiibacterota bacterium]
MTDAAPTDLTPAEQAVLSRYLTNVDRRVFALRNLPEVVMGALFSRYSRTEKSLRRVLLDEFLAEPATGIPGPGDRDQLVDRDRAEAFYERVLVGYGDDSVAELAYAHVAIEQVSQLAAKAIEDARIGLSPLEKSTRYVRFDRRDANGRYPYHRGRELADPAYEPALDRLFDAYGELVPQLLGRVRAQHPIAAGESERAWKAATRARAFDLLRGLLPAATLTNLGLAGSGRAFEYLLTKLLASSLPEANALSGELHRELSEVIPAFVRRGVDERYGAPAAARLRARTQELAAFAPPASHEGAPFGVRLVEQDPDAERRVAAALLFAVTDRALGEIGPEPDLRRLLGTVAQARHNRRDRLPRAFEHAAYTFEITANFGAYRDLQRHRLLTQERQALGTRLGYDVPPDLDDYGLGGAYREALEQAGAAHRQLTDRVGSDLAQYAVPLAFRLRWYVRVNLRELCHLVELRTTPQGHPDYRQVAQEMFQLVQQAQPALASTIRFVDLGPGEELERRASERRTDDRLRSLER